MSRTRGANRRDQGVASVTRRTTLAGAVAIPLGSNPAGASDVVEKLVDRAARKNAAFMNGEMAEWSELAQIGEGFTLMQPFGGEASRNFDRSPERLAALARYFRRGTTALEVAQTYASNDLVVLVVIERQRAEVGGLPEQDWSLRVTEVYRRSGPEWLLVHRHADPLVRPITLQQASVIARGALPG